MHGSSRNTTIHFRGSDHDKPHLKSASIYGRNFFQPGSTPQNRSHFQTSSFQVCISENSHPQTKHVAGRNKTVPIAKSQARYRFVFREILKNEILFHETKNPRISFHKIKSFSIVSWKGLSMCG